MTCAAIAVLEVAVFALPVALFVVERRARLHAERLLLVALGVRS